MTTIALVVVGLAFLARTKIGMRNNPGPRRFGHLTGWQKLFGVVAMVLALVVILNPEFIVLGLVGDTAFFDVLVLGLALQGYALAARVHHLCRMPLRDLGRRLGIPGPGLAYMLGALVFAARSVEGAVHRLADRLL